MTAKRALAYRLNKRVTIMRPVEVDDGRGGYTTEWQVVAEPWAEVVGLAGREAVIDHALQGVAVYRICIRWRADIRAADQVRVDSLTLNIKSASDPDGRREQLVLVADTEAVRA